MSKDACTLCGEDPAEGFATINDERYCHSDTGPSCYVRESLRFTSLDLGTGRDQATRALSDFFSNPT